MNAGSPKTDAARRPSPCRCSDNLRGRAIGFYGSSRWCIRTRRWNQLELSAQSARALWMQDGPSEYRQQYEFSSRKESCNVPGHPVQGFQLVIQMSLEFTCKYSPFCRLIGIVLWKIRQSRPGNIVFMTVVAGFALAALTATARANTTAPDFVPAVGDLPITDFGPITLPRNSFGPVSGGPGLVTIQPVSPSLPIDGGPSAVPDAGSTVDLLGLSLIGLAAVRRRLIAP